MLPNSRLLLSFPLVLARTQSHLETKQPEQTSSTNTLFSSTQTIFFLLTQQPVYREKPLKLIVLIIGRLLAGTESRGKRIRTLVLSLHFSLRSSWSHVPRQIGRSDEFCALEHQTPLLQSTSAHPDRSSSRSRDFSATRARVASRLPL